MSVRATLLAAAAASVVSAASASAAAITLTGGATLPTTAGGATFSDTAGEFVVANPDNLFGNITGAYISNSSFTPDTLNISFASPVTALSFDYAVVDFFASSGTDSITVTPDVGAAETFTAVESADFYPEGSASFSTGAAFSSVSITGVLGFAAGDFVTTSAAAAVPEPASIAAVGAGLLGLLGLRRRV